MKIHLPMNAIIVPVNRRGQVHYFFLDSGFPVSFSLAPGVVPNVDGEDFDGKSEFLLELRPAPIDVTALSECLMIRLAGFLGMDFFSQFENIKVDFKSREVTFNAPDFHPDLELDLLGTDFMMTMAAFGPEDDFRPCLVDTGAYQTLLVGEAFPGKPKSEGWEFPAAYGNMAVDFYCGIELRSPSAGLGSFVVGGPRNAPDIPFEGVLGLNLLSRYECCFDLPRGKIGLRENPRELRFGADLGPEMFTAGIQVVSRNGRLVIANVLPGFSDTRFRPGMSVHLEGVDLAGPEAVNAVYERLTSMGREKEIALELDGQPVVVKTRRMFR